MAPNIPQSGTAGRSVWYTGVHSFFRVFEQEVATMLKRVLACTTVLALCALPLAAQGHAATAGNEMTITRQVVDLNCFTTNGQSGAGHKPCAQACPQAGGPPRRPSTHGSTYDPV